MEWLYQYNYSWLLYTCNLLQQAGHSKKRIVKLHCIPRQLHSGSAHGTTTKLSRCRRSGTNAVHGSDQSMKLKANKLHGGSIWERSCLDCQLGPWTQENKNCASLKHECSDGGWGCRVFPIRVLLRRVCRLIKSLIHSLSALRISPRGEVVVMKTQERQSPDRPGFHAELRQHQSNPDPRKDRLMIQDYGVFLLIGTNSPSSPCVSSVAVSSVLVHFHTTEMSMMASLCRVLQRTRIPIIVVTWCLTNHRRSRSFHFMERGVGYLMTNQESPILLENIVRVIFGQS